MKLTRHQLEQAVEQDIISQIQAQQLADFLTLPVNDTPRFDFTHVLYYLGGMIAIGAMTLFMTLGWETFGGLGIFFISLLYAGIGLKLTQSFQRRGYSVPAIICATFVVALTPLAVYGLQQGLGLWPESDSQYRDYHRYIDWQWWYMELATLVVGLIMLWRLRYSFLLMPIAFTLWYISMDFAALLYGGWPGFELRALVSLYFGLMMVLIAFWVDLRKTTVDYAFWLYLFGVITFWSGLTLQESDSELAKLGYCLINLVMIFIGAFLLRRVFVVFGALGVTGYLGYLSYDVFQDSLLFPFMLTLIGFAIIYLGIVWQKYESRISQSLRQHLPIALQGYLSHK